MRQISRTGMMLATSGELDVGRTLALRLSHREDIIDVYGAVRWCRPETAEEGPTARYEVGIAFTEVGQVEPQSLWRSLTAYRAEKSSG